MEEVVYFFKKRGYLVSNDFIESIPEDFDCDDFFKKLKKKILKNDEIVVLNKDIFRAISENEKLIELNWKEFDNSKALLEKGKDGEGYNTFLNLLNFDINKTNKILAEIKKEEKEISIEEFNGDKNNVIVLKSYKEEAKKRNVDDFVYYFRKRFETISNILKTRQELKEVLSLSRVIRKKDNERVAVIGIVVEKKITKNENVMIRLEDLSGDINILINKNKIEIYNNAKDICEDEVLGIIGLKNKGFIYVEDLIFPDVPLSEGLKKYDEEVYCCFISDLHIGNKMFLKENFEKFLKWLDCDYGDLEQKRIAEKIKYLFIAGDLVDGVGVYSGQEKDCEINDIYKQYELFTDLIKKIPRSIKIIIIPGNHDALRLTEPQPGIGKEYCEELLNMENIFMVSNPSLVNIHSNANFAGFNVLTYHGASFNYYIDNIESIRLNGGYKRADLVMQFLIKRRHLAPTHVSTSYIPDAEKDPLVIDKIPDFLVTGHIHRLSISNYRKVSLVNASCWIGQTDFQEKIGLVPQPCKVVVANLQTREMKVLNFENGSE